MMIEKELRLGRPPMLLLRIETETLIVSTRTSLDASRIWISPSPTIGALAKVIRIGISGQTFFALFAGNTAVASSLACCEATGAFPPSLAMTAIACVIARQPSQTTTRTAVALDHLYLSFMSTSLVWQVVS